jgi:hypothetical protein
MFPKYVDGEKVDTIYDLIHNSANYHATIYDKGICFWNNVVIRPVCKCTRRKIIDTIIVLNGMQYNICSCGLPNRQSAKPITKAMIKEWFEE